MKKGVFLVVFLISILAFSVIVHASVIDDAVNYVRNLFSHNSEGQHNAQNVKMHTFSPDSATLSGFNHLSGKSVNRINKKTTLYSSGNISLKENNVSSVTLSGNVKLDDPKGYARVSVIDDKGNEHLVFQSDNFYVTGEHNFNDFCFETCELEEVNLVSLKFEVKNASIYIDKINFDKNLKFSRKDIEDSKKNQQRLVIDSINKRNKELGLNWTAGETSVSNLSFAKKRVILGVAANNELPNLQGLEYYRGGVFRLITAADETGNGIESVMTTALAPDLPSSFDWRNAHGENWNTPIKNQGGCGSCWDFSAVGTVETDINLYFNRHINQDLSEQAVLSCSGGGDCVVGGYPDAALSYFKSTGVSDEACFPYAAVDTAGCNFYNCGFTNMVCSMKCSNYSQRTWKIGNYYSVYSNMLADENTIKRAIIHNGSVATAIYSIKHAIVVEGYRDDPSGTFWIYKNSWGSDWGENGYGEIQDADYLIDFQPYFVIYPIIQPSSTSYNVSCVDRDGDGYCNWGLGSKPASGCPSCSSTEDCDDSNLNVHLCKDIVFRTCVDSDGGDNPLTKGTAVSCLGSDCSMSSTDYCTSSVGLKEFYCNSLNGFISNSSETCSGICNDGACKAVCGNNVLESPEVCDSSNLGGKTCRDFGFDYGVLSCNSSCSGFNTNLCRYAVCGNNICEHGETCSSCQSDCGTCSNFSGEYYNNKNLQVPVTFLRNDSSINFDWGTGSPDASIPADLFSVRWTKKQYFSSGSYNFFMTTDDGGRLFIDNNLTIDKWVDQSPTTYSASAILASGNHSLKMEYYENGGGAVAQLSWDLISTGICGDNNCDPEEDSFNCPQDCLAGSLSFSGCAILDQSNKVYEQTQNIIPNQTGNCINILANNITLDCRGYWIGNRTLFNATIIYSNKTGTTIKNCNISMSGTGSGIFLENSSNSYVYNNILSSLQTGILLRHSNNLLLDNNYIQNITQLYQINYVSDLARIYTYGGGISIYESANNSFTNNKITNIFGNGISVDKDVDGIDRRSNSTNNIFLNNNMENLSGDGIYLFRYANNNRIINNSIKNGNRAIIIRESDNVTISGNKLVGNFLSVIDLSNARYQNNLFLSRNNNLLRFTSNRNIDINKKNNYVVTMLYLNDSPVSSVVINSIKTNPDETVSYSTSGNKILFNFTATRQGIYSVLINGSDNSGNNVVERVYLGNTSSVKYYFRDIENVSHGQRPGAKDRGLLVLDSPTIMETSICGIWIEWVIDNRSLNFEGGISRILDTNAHIVSRSEGGPALFGITNAHPLGFSDVYFDDAKFLPEDGTRVDANMNMSSNFWLYNQDWWYGVVYNIVTDNANPYMYMYPNDPPYVNITYLFSAYPKIITIGNMNVNLISAVSPVNARYANITLEGNNRTNITIEMPYSDAEVRGYGAYLDDNICNSTSSTCRILSISGKNLSYDLNINNQSILEIIPTNPQAANISILTDKNSYNTGEKVYLMP